MAKDQKKSRLNTKSAELIVEKQVLIKRKRKTYNSQDSLVVTHPTTNWPACGLSTAERTGSPVLHTLWSYRQSGENRSKMGSAEV
ncbi:hypothetical protein NUU61_000671 [Penicillium alfredii]|uniref:Uncharacterized protein n=1 Tax=Penicillium alfredii TaxID=1506179 RepID=A0A9W9GAD6_9EURO|nr:hypothetical protein NUU61_000671 [Penicillium alfredii]